MNYYQCLRTHLYMDICRYPVSCWNAVHESEDNLNGASWSLAEPCKGKTLKCPQSLPPLGDSSSILTLKCLHTAGHAESPLLWSPPVHSSADSSLIFKTVPTTPRLCVGGPTPPCLGLWGYT